MEALNSIHIVIARPASKNTYSYTINGNVEDHNIATNDSFYRFLCSLISPPATRKVAQFIQTFQPFIVNVPNNEAKRLTFDKEEISKQEYENSRKIKMSDVLGKAMEENPNIKKRDISESLMYGSEEALEKLNRKISPELYGR